MLPKKTEKMADLMKGITLLNKELEEVKAEEALAGKVVALYFSAGWCPPCKQFTPKLHRLYNALRSNGKPFEVVFFTRDRSRADFEENFTEKHGDWLSVKFDDPILTRYPPKFEVKSIPVCRIINSAGKIVEMDGKTIITEHGKEKALELFAKWEEACKKSLPKNKNVQFSE
ncbi:unnamed protein product [Caenorhabditis angaria]|uniref:Thioredoxin domain-containing protein n=1 Tax=Caenorhabditis angaria TaxID=860376 RepID=A0A9P1ITY4_9PELO|nr:unnamed protein product [Caenorhabditis angaria]